MNRQWLRLFPIFAVIADIRLSHLVLLSLLWTPFPESTPHLVIVDVKMERVGGFDVLRECRERFPNTTVIMITAYASVETAVEAMKMGAYDYITKPFKVDELQLCVQRALDYQATLRENSQQKREIRDPLQI